MKKLLILAIILPLAGCNLFGSDGDKKSLSVVVQPSDPVTPEEPPAEEEPVNETREEMIERELNLPPEPDEAENNATILGVDVNGNNIRDDVERKIAFDLYDQPAEMKRHMRYAEMWTETFLAEGDKDKLVALEQEKQLNLRCHTVDISEDATREERYQVYDARYKTGYLLGNSRDRKNAYIRAGFYQKDKLGGNRASKEEVRTYCSQFNN